MRATSRYQLGVRASSSGSGKAPAPSSTSAVVMRTVADHAQLVVQIVLMTSSKTVGLARIRPAPVLAHPSVSSPEIYA